MSLISVITGISVCGVGLGVAALVVVLSVMNGFYGFVRDLLVSLDPHVRIVSAEGGGLADVDSLRTLALSIDHVEQAAPYVEGKALLLHDGRADVNKVTIVRGVDPATLRGVSRVVEQTGFGRFELGREAGVPGIVVGMSLAQRLALAPGGGGEASQVALLSAPAVERMLTTLLGAPPLSRFEVRGLYELEPGYDESHVFVDLAEAQRLFRMGDRVSGLELRLDDLERADAVKAALVARLDADRYEVRTWYDLQRSLYDVMRLEKWGASVILFLIVIVAAFNIVGSLTMVVIEKRRDVGVLRTMGVSQRDVRRIFQIEGLLVGLVGTGAGLAVGLTLALLQQYFGLVPLSGGGSFMIDAYPIRIQPLDLLLVTVASLGLCGLASIYPAMRAARTTPGRAVGLQG